MFRYNKGEWSEIYAFTYLLSKGTLYSADKDLNIIYGSYYPIIKIIREEERGRKLDYFYGKKVIQIKHGEELLGEIETDKMRAITEELLEKIPEGERAFEIPTAEAFFREIYINKIKANSTAKEDITLQLQDIHTGIAPVCGFSIKSFLGARPTLVNPGMNTNFTFIVENCNDDLMESVNSIDTRTKIKDRIRLINSAGCVLKPVEHSISPTFEDNLYFIDLIMPSLLQELVRISYVYDLVNVNSVVNQLADENSFNLRKKEIYSYKVKKLLCAFALGMTPERTEWLGSEDANGGYITVKNDGEVVCYHIYNRTDFEDYLLNYTVFERPSTTRYNYMNIFKEDGVYKINLCLQIRFTDVR